MPSRKPAAAGLYDIEVDPPVLLGTGCTACGTAFFPPIEWGCERCGAPGASLQQAPLGTHGTVHASASVHALRPGDEPYAVADVLLDAGPLVRVLLASPTDAGLRMGDRVVATWAEVGTDDGEPVVEPRFVKAASR